VLLTAENRAAEVLVTAQDAWILTDDRSLNVYAMKNFQNFKPHVNP